MILVQDLLDNPQSHRLVLEAIAWVGRLLLFIDLHFPGDVREPALVVYYRLIVAVGEVIEYVVA